MILFFYGENDYLLNRKLRELKNRYEASSHGNFDLINLDGKELTFEKFAAQVQTVALFATTRLVIIDQIFDAPKEVQDKVKQFLDKISPQTVVVFIHRGQPDKRLGLFKTLNKPKISQNFQKVPDEKLADFIIGEANTRNGKILRPEAKYLSEIVGNNLWQLSNEVEKLATYCEGRTIDRIAIDLLVSQNLSANVFAMIDNMIRHHNKLAFDELEKLLLLNEPPLKILGAIIYQIRIMAQIVEVGVKQNPFELSKKIGAQYFQVKNLAPVCEKVSRKEISRIYQLLSACDEQIKTGKIEPEEGLKELVLSF